MPPAFKEALVGQQVSPGTKLLEVTRFSALDFKNIDKTFSSEITDFIAKNGTDAKLNYDDLIKKIAALLKMKEDRLVIGFKLLRSYKNISERIATDPMAILAKMELLEMKVFRAPQCNDRIALLTIARTNQGILELGKHWAGNKEFTLPELLK